MKTVISALVAGVVLLSTLFGNAVMGAEAEERTYLMKDPKHTWVFLVGVLKWQKGAGLSSFSEKDRRDLQLKEWFIEQGVPADHVVYLPDSDATLARINKELDAMMAKTAPGDTLFSYYCGHGWVTDGKAYYGNYDAGSDPNSCLSVRKFVNAVATNFKGSTAFFTADCCHSGAIGEELARAKAPFQWATVTSAISAISSTGNWTFTQALLDCLRGHKYADTNNDGEITYEEFAKYVNAEMSSLERQKASAASSPDFDKEMVISEVQFPDETMPERAEVLWKEKWYPAKVLERKDGQSKIRWVSIGWDTSASDEWVDDSRVRKPPPADDNLPLATAKKWNIGDKVQVKWRETWYPAVIKKYNDGEYYIHYTGYEDSYDEWVSPKAIK